MICDRRKGSACFSLVLLIRAVCYITSFPTPGREPGDRYRKPFFPFHGDNTEEVLVTTTKPEIDVAYVANLARLDLDAKSCALFQRQLGTIVDYVRQIGELDLDGIEPTSHGQPVYNVFREDVERPGLEHERVMANAPARLEDEFKVPRIVE